MIISIILAREHISGERKEEMLQAKCVSRESKPMMEPGQEELEQLASPKTSTWKGDQGGFADQCRMASAQMGRSS